MASTSCRDSHKGLPVSADISRAISSLPDRYWASSFFRNSMRSSSDLADQEPKAPRALAMTDEISEGLIGVIGEISGGGCGARGDGFRGALFEAKGSIAHGGAYRQPERGGN